MSLRAEMLRLGIRMFLKRHRQPFDVGTWRANMHRMERWVPRPPRSTKTSVVQASHLRLHRIATPASQPGRNVLYLHGGAYVSGAPIYYRHFTWRIANVTKSTVWALEYRLAPEHPFPAALDDAVAGFLWLAGETGDPGELFVMGDSAGGGLALCLLLRLRDERKPLPAAAVAMSPWTDLALTAPSLIENAASDPMLNVRDVPEFVRCYLAGADPYNPHASPLYGDAFGLPPVLIHVGSDEILRDDAVRMADKLKQGNPRSRLEVWPRMPHVFQLFVPVLPEAHAAITQIGEFISNHRCDTASSAPGPAESAMRSG
ncbi:alpha/beta hydrolase [Bradyrhizobium genosp. SA-3]|uniref:alpha/beta hydrolase n=1 Tax=Bradyrhizobium genosp. SA-3 TaxID=508868 RepID=UPI0013EE6D8C|nr:alpha/beta hydrolase [Bradyrhizobium genosp. SA-3]